MVQEFGGDWTEKKLDRLKKYLIAYQEALKYKPFRKIYIDAFSGSGERCETLENGEIKFFEGSARIALELERKFDDYFFIEKNNENCNKLELLIKEKGAIENARICKGDANVKIPKICENITKDKIFNRGIVFLDPFACNVSWDIIKIISKTEILDMWYLFPTGAVLRTMPRNEMQLRNKVGWTDRLNFIFGTEDWRLLYKQGQQQDLFGYNDFLRANVDEVEDFFHNKLKNLFPFVCEKPMRLLNSNNAPMFSLFFAASNPSEKAGKLALNIANHLLRDKKS